MTARELKAKRLALGFGCRDALAKALGTTKTRRDTGNTAAGPPRAGCAGFIDAWNIPKLVGPRKRN